MCLRLPNEPQTQFDLDNLQHQNQPFSSKTMLKFQIMDTVYQRVYEFFCNLVKSELCISSLFEHLQPTLKKCSSIQKLQMLYQHPKFSSTTSISQRLSIRLFSETQEQLSYLTVSDLDMTIEEETFQSQYKLTPSLIQSLFDRQQQELILVSVGIAVKYLYMSKEKIKDSKIFYLLVVATILGNKVYHDADMPQIIKECSEGLGVSSSKLKNLQRRMLKSIDYDCKVGKYTLMRLKFYLFG